MLGERRRLDVLITVKTYPIPSTKYDELVCTAGVTREHGFVRLYPINFRDLPAWQQYRKYTWITVDAEKHTGRDSRKESWRPDCESLRIGNFIPANPGNWAERSQFVMPLLAESMEELGRRQKKDRTSLGLVMPREVTDLRVIEAEPCWPPRFLAQLKQARLWEDRKASKRPPRKVPWKFQYRFRCFGRNCRGHQMMIEDWEAGRLYWREIDDGKNPQEAAKSVRHKFLHDICGPDRDTYFFVGTVLAYGTWVVVGTYYPKREPPRLPLDFGPLRGAD